MGLPIKPSTNLLHTGPMDVIWPTDTAVDFDASDLVSWSRGLGSGGLVIRPGGEPDVIRIRPLRELELEWLLRDVDGWELFAGAARIGVIRVPGIPLRRERMRMVQWLDDNSMHRLNSEDLKASVPFQVLLREMLIARLGSEAGDDPIDETAMDRVSMLHALGVLILTATFRLR